MVQAGSRIGLTPVTGLAVAVRPAFNARVDDTCSSGACVERVRWCPERSCARKLRRERVVDCPVAVVVDAVTQFDSGRVDAGRRVVAVERVVGRVARASAGELRLTATVAKVISIKIRVKRTQDPFVDVAIAIVVPFIAALGASRTDGRCRIIAVQSAGPFVAAGCANKAISVGV